MAAFASRIAYNALGLIAGSILANNVCAHEPGDFGQFFRGATISDALGAAPPAGLYYENTAFYTPEAPGHGQVAGFTPDALVEGATVIWSTGWKFLGANVVMVAAQVYFVVNAWPSAEPGPPFTNATHYPAWHTTLVNPLTLSWNLPNNWYASIGINFWVPDGSHYNNTPNPDYWAIEPSAAISYLGDGWNLTAHFVYDINGASAGHTGPFASTPNAAFGIGYRSGQQAYLDLTATKKFGNWEIGPVGYLRWQPTTDRPGSGFSCAAMAAVTGVICGRATDFAFGGLIGYDFGQVKLKLYLTDSVYTKDDFGGLIVWTKVAFKIPDLPGPSAPPPFNK
jgi:hypothetical protein